MSKLFIYFLLSFLRDENVVNENNNICFIEWSFPHNSVSKTSACNTGDLGSNHGSGRSPGEGNDNPFPLFLLENSMNRGAWQATVHGVTRVGHDLVTKPPPSPPSKYMQNLFLTNSTAMYQIQLIITDLDYSVTS